MEKVKAHLVSLGLYGLGLCLMNICFYNAFERLPIGIVSVFAFIGPLGMSILKSRKISDSLWGVLAGIGIVLLSPVVNESLNLGGVGFALLAGLFWALYILISEYIATIFPDGDAVGVATLVAALPLIPWGLEISSVSAALSPKFIFALVGVAALSSVIPFTCDFYAVRFLSARVFGVLLSFEPAIAALSGFVILQEHLGLRSLLGTAMIIIAGIGVSLFSQANADQPQVDKALLLPPSRFATGLPFREQLILTESQQQELVQALKEVISIAAPRYLEQGLRLSKNVDELIGHLTKYVPPERRDDIRRIVLYHIQKKETLLFREQCVNCLSTVIGRVAAMRLIKQVVQDNPDLSDRDFLKELGKKLPNEKAKRRFNEELSRFSS
ncbi:EamA family transporter [Oculatella sp. LEGE 06141]|uniref:EamA family transporter n=1 Tax=Oculatella sp. LEGE 06141 TaxID=1828648 RepID=UPI00187F9503|nr:EamA family transporter [Oculatella sp. LEGE 06141]MBE9180200.1 EamA family transporter [Oculatella sp. LEGE 06141]